MKSPLRFLILAAAALCVAAPAAAKPTPKPPKGQLGVNVRVTNRTQHCAWVTIYFARFYTPWAIAHDPHNRPRFVHVDSYYDFNILIPDVLPASPAEIKVRTEVMRNADCSGGQIADLSEENKAVYGDSAAGMIKLLNSELSGDAKNGFRLTKPY
jgi:hypothetical protein